MSTLAEQELSKLKDKYYSLDISAPRYYRRSFETVYALTRVNIEICPETQKHKLEKSLEELIFIRDKTHGDINEKLSTTEDVYYMLRMIKDPSASFELSNGNCWTASELGDILAQVRDDLSYHLTRQLLAYSEWKIERER